MTPEEQQMLREALELSRKNNETLNKLYRAAIWGRAIKILYWAVIIGVSFGALYFVKPYLETLQGVYGGSETTKTNVRDLFSF